MQRKKINLILAILCGIPAFAANNYDFSAMCESGQTLYYKITSSTAPYTAKIVPQNSSSPYYSTYPISDLMIPSSVTYNSVTYTVTRIEDKAFFGCSGLLSVAIPNTVTNIGNDAFYGCSGLTSVTIPNSVTSIGSSAFRGCSGLTSVSIPNSVTAIRPDTFYGCIGLTSVTIGNGVGSIYRDAFYGCSGLSSITLGNSVTSIGLRAFYGCTSLAEITIPNSVTTIDSCAFYGCSGLSGALVIPNSVTSIGQSTFYNCSSLTSLTLGNSVTEIKQSTFKNCSGLTSVTIPNSVTSIGSAAFSDCNGITSVYYTGTVAQWCGIDFYRSDAQPLSAGCDLYINDTIVTNLVIPNTVTEIKQCTFCGASFTSVTIPNSVTSIGNYAFQGCSSLTSINIPNSVTEIGERAFEYCYRLTSITIPNSVTEIKQSTFRNCSGLTSIDIPDSVTEIGSGAFDGCSGLTAVYYTGDISEWCGISFASQPLSNANNLYVDNNLVTNLVIPNGVTEIKPLAFEGATCLTSVTIPNSVTSIGNSAFAGCTGLTSVTIPNSVTSIGGGTFRYCSGLTSVTIGNGVTSIGALAFAYCTSLTTVNFNATNCTTMGGPSDSSSSRAFASSNANAAINIGSGVTVIPPGAFQGLLGNGTLTIPNSVTSIGQYAFCGCRGLTSVTIPNSITSIDQSVFNGCSGLTSVTIPNSVTSIGTKAFYGCNRLTSVIIGNGVTSIGTNAFKNCSGLTNIYVNALTPPTIESTSFPNYAATLWVRCGLTSTYSAANLWSNFGDIRESRAYMLSVSSANPQQGTASVIEQPTTCTNATAVIGATPNRGYTFSQWNDGNTNNPRTVNVTTFAEYTASFAAMPSYTITAVSADETRGTVTGGGIYYVNETATLTATPNGGYTFGSWNDGNTSNPRTITVTGNATYTATFLGSHTITVSSADTNMGTVSGGGTYTEGSLIEISATPAVHHHFVQWNDGNTENPRTITVTGDAAYTASFAIDQHTITVVSADEVMGTVSEGGTYDYGTEIQISATPAEGYGFVSWNDGNTDNPRTITVTSNMTYTATFGAWRTITIVSADETQGTVQGIGEYIEGTTIQITAIPNEHYHFLHWIDEENPTRDFNTDNPRTITVSCNMTYTAVFAINQHTITVESADEAMGTVSGGGTFPFGTEIQISATASENYRFVAWTDGSTDNPRTVRVVGDAEYVAAFSWDAGIEENAVSEIALFPNPATDILNITSSEPISEIEIVNVMGQVVRRVEVNSDNAVCNVEDLTSGVYVVRIRTASATLSQQRFVKE